MAKFYAVKGENNQIFTDWEECKAFINENKAYKYKSFSTKEEAEAFLEDRDYYAESLLADLAQGFAVAYTDGSFEESIGKYAYGVVAVSPDGNERKLSGVGETPEFLPTRNIAGEVDGVLTAVKWAFLNGYAKLKIYHDYAGLSEWAMGRWNASSPISVYYVKEFNKYRGAVDVYFHKVKGHSNHKYNEEVDQLAKSALKDGVEQKLNGVGYKISGKYFFDDMVSWIRKKAPKVILKERGDGYAFLLGDEKLLVYKGLSATGIAGNRGKLYCLSVQYFLENHDDLGVNRLIERVFDTEVDCDAVLKTQDIVKIALKFLNGNFSASLIFPLSKMEQAIKKALGQVEKISPYFTASENGFVCLKEVENKKEIEKAYEFFYKYRTRYFSLNLSEEETLEISSRAQSLLTF